MGVRKRSAAVVDLTGSDEEVTRPEKVARSSQSVHYSPPPSPSSSQLSFGREIAGQSFESLHVDYNDDDGNEIIQSTQARAFDSDSYEQYGKALSKVVGLRFYSGYANNGERVILKREPNNPYDNNAIQAINVEGQKIGHVPRQMAAKLAPLVDSGDIIIEGVLAGPRGEFDIALDLHMFGPSEIVNKERVKGLLRSQGLDLSILLRKEQDATRQHAVDLKHILKAKKPDRNVDTQWANGALPTGNGTKEIDLDVFVQTADKFNPRDCSEVAEKYGAQEDQLEALPKAEQPKGIATKLLPFQLQGLAWLIDHENPMLPDFGSTDVVQLWKSTSKKRYTNIATNFSLEDEDPELIRGGILADDMGLGKTLQIISLIIADKLKYGGKVGPTLIVAPVSVMSNWSTQIEKHVRKSQNLRVYTYHGSARKNMKSDDLEYYDVVITTYGTLSVEYMPKGSKVPLTYPTKEGLYSVHWRRIVLDEGHIIRNPNTKNALAVCAVRVDAKWVLSGTPIINSLKDLYSLVKFLGLSGGLARHDIFNSVLIRPIKEGHANAQLLLQALMATICLRRRKDMSFINLKLPTLTEYIHQVELSPSEQKKYNALQDEAKGVLQIYTDANSTGNGQKAQQTYRHLLEILLRLRQVCNHWKMCEERVLNLMAMLEKDGTVNLSPENVKALQAMLQLSIESREECPVCMDDLHEPIITHCGHIFGKSCIQRVIETQHKCPMCRSVLEDESKLVPPALETGDDVASSSVVDPAELETSAKTEALLSLVSATLEKKPDTKIVIFSQWCRYLDIISPRLVQSGHKLVRIDGSMPAQARDRSLHDFDNDPNTKIMLASLGVCAVGLNLVVADTVIMCDSWWAPAIEDQAVDRVHRLGQKRKCTVWRLVVKDSVEGRTLDIQSEKRKLMTMAMREGENTKRGKRGRGTIGDIRRLLD